MSQLPYIKAPGKTHDFLHAEEPEHRSVIEGLLGRPAAISPKYFYDPLGSRLFELITHLPEYYPTRVERGIFLRSGEEIAAVLGPGRVLIDLGAGNCEKAESLFPVFRPRQYVAVDIASEFLEGVLRGLQARNPDIEVLNAATDFSTALDLPEAVGRDSRVFFFPGSSIGNFTPAGALDLLRRIREHCMAGDYLLIGVDLVKDTRVLEAAYDDALGITAAFNLNVLNHVNRLIGSDFAVAGWRHRSFFNREERRIEMHLEARHAQTVNWAAGCRSFAAGECIHTENSYKYDTRDFGKMLAEGGFCDVQVWTDPERWFAVFLARAS